MSLMKFYEGSEAKAQSYLDGLYLASDSNKLYYNGKSYTPDLTDMKNSIGTNVYTDSNYISKETNLTDAILQLDEEIKATNDNLSLEHENAEATYAKQTDLSDYLPLTQANTNFTSFKRMLASNSDTWGKMNVGGYVVAYTADLSDVSENGPFSIIGGNQATVIQVNPGANDYSSQLAMGFDRPQLAFRRTDSTGDESKWGPWQKVLTWDNIDDKPEFKTIGGETILGSGNFDIATESDITALFN